MKTITIYLSLLLSVSLFSSGSFAGYPDLKKSRKASSVVVTVKEFIETEINFEKWMVDLKEFNSESTVDNECDIPIEEWMKKEFSSFVEIEKLSEQELSIEDWMTNTFDFLYQDDSFDPDLEIEPWMCEIIR